LGAGRVKSGRARPVGGYSLGTRAGSSVGRDVLGGGYQALLAGEIGRNLRAGVQGLELRGTIGGDAEVEVGARQGGASPYMGGAPPGVVMPVVPGGLTLADPAQVKGRLVYTRSEERRV